MVAVTSSHSVVERSHSSLQPRDGVDAPFGALHVGSEPRVHDKYEELLYDIPLQVGTRAASESSREYIDKTVSDAAKAVTAKPSPSMVHAAATKALDDPLRLQWRQEASSLQGGTAGGAGATEQLQSIADEEVGVVRLREQTPEEQRDADAHALPAAAVEAEAAFRAALLSSPTAVEKGEERVDSAPSTFAEGQRGTALVQADDASADTPLTSQTPRAGLEVAEDSTRGSDDSRATSPRPSFVPGDGCNGDASAPTLSRHLFAISLPEAVDVPAVVFYQEEAVFEEELLDQIQAALDTITAACSATNPKQTGDAETKQADMDNSKDGSVSGGDRRREVILSCAESCHFFTPRVASYVVSGAVLLKRHQLLQRIRENQHLTFIAKVERTSSALDVGAEIFLACKTRYLSGAGCVGFPSLRLGYTLMPATLDVLCGALGVERTALWTPILHETDARTAFSAYGLIRSGDVGAEVVDDDGTDRRADSHRSRQRPLHVHWESRLLRWCSSTTWRERLLKYVFLSRSFDAKVQAMPPWARHFASTVLLFSCTADKQAVTDLVIERSSTLAASDNARRAMNLQKAVARAAVCRSLARSSSATPIPREFLVFRGSESSWDTLVRRLDPRRSQVLVLDMSPRCRARSEAQLTTLCAEWNGLEGFGVVLIGRRMDTELAARSLKVCALLSPSGWSRAGDIPIYEVAVRCAEQSGAMKGAPGGEEANEELASAATEFALKELGAAALRTNGDATDRLLAAFCLEVCRLLQAVDVAMVENISREVLTIDKSPLSLLDFFGAEHLLYAINHSPSTPLAEVVPVCGREALLRMKAHGLLGSGCSAGGFYTYSAASTYHHEAQRNPARRRRVGAASEQAEPAVLNPHVLKQFIRPSPSANEVAHRLLFSLVNECCALLTDGSVSTASDANLLASHGLGVAKSLGGVLGFADSVGWEAMLERMQVLSNMYGASYAPHRLLVLMQSRDETFETLTSGTLELARQLKP